MSGIPTFVEHAILALDAERGTFYQSFEEFWDQRMEPMQFIPREAKGVFAALRQTLKDRAQEQYLLFMARLPTGPDCGSLPQAGELGNLSPSFIPSLIAELLHD